MTTTIRALTEADAPWVLEVYRSWGADFIVSRGKAWYPHQLEGYLAETDDGRKVGLVTFYVDGRQAEIVSLDAFEKFSGLGTRLMRAVEQDVAARGANRLWLITTNDNIDAIRFYQRRGFRLAGIHVGAIAYSRAMKASIPLVGYYQISIYDEIEFEKMLGPA